MNFLHLLKRIYLKRQGIFVAKNCQLHNDVVLKQIPSFFKTKPGKIYLQSGAKISKGCILDCYGGEINVGEDVFVGPYCVFYGHGNITIGCNTLIAMGCKIIAANHAIPGPNELIRLQPDLPKQIVIGKDVWLGADVKVLAGVTIGDGCIVGAGSVVLSNLPSYTIAVGSPARVVKQRGDKMNMHSEQE